MLPQIETSTKATRRRWTILVYLSQEQNLSDAMIVALKSIYRVGTSTRFNVFVQLNREDGAPRRFDVSSLTNSTSGFEAEQERRSWDKDGGLERMGREVSVTKPPRFDLPGPDRAQRRINQAILKEFLISGIRDNDSDHYLVILSGHGTGVVGRDMKHDAFGPGGIRTIDLRPLFVQVKKVTGRTIDVLGMDTCFMNMAEICWELRHTARYLVASEGITPQGGWPYHRVLEMFQENHELTPQQVARNIVSGYLRYYADYVVAERSVDLSACELAKVSMLVAAVETLALCLVEKLSLEAVRDSVVLSHWRSQSYKSEEYTDLWDFCDLLYDTCADPSVRTACGAVLRALSDSPTGLVAKSIYSGPEVQHSHGLSIYFPWSEIAPSYGAFDFARRSKWIDFLNKYHAVTRREMRGESRRPESLRYPLGPALNSGVSIEQTAELVGSKRLYRIDGGGAVGRNPGGPEGRHTEDDSHNDKR